MTHKLIPRFSPAQAAARLEESQEHLRQGKHPLELVQIELAGAIPNPTGGEAATHTDLSAWRVGLMNALNGIRTGSKRENDIHSIELGKALDKVINPSPSDAAHDGVWSFLSLMVFPDVVHARWPADPITHELSRDRWIGRQLGRDRNYLKLSWRRWRALGTVMEEATTKLGEDEFGALLERSAVARNLRLVQAAAQEIVAFTDDGARTEFARALMKRVTYQTGPLNLDVLSTEELTDLVRDCGASVLSLGAPRRAIVEPSGLRARTHGVATPGTSPAVPSAMGLTMESEAHPLEEPKPTRLLAPSPTAFEPKKHEFSCANEADGKVRVTCSCGFTVRRRKSGVERLEALHRLHPKLTDSELSQIQAITGS